jgi:hypothetical protein
LVGPACGCLTGLESVVVGDVLAEPVGQIVLRPRGREVASEVGEAVLVDLDHAVLADRAFPPGHGSGEHPGDVGVGLLGWAGNVAKHRGNREVCFDVAFVVRRVSGRGRGGRPDRGSSVGCGSYGAFRGGRLTGLPCLIGHKTRTRLTSVACEDTI